jgi:hypothetical protein
MIPRFPPLGYLALGLILGRLARRDRHKLKTSTMVIEDPRGSYTVQVPSLPSSVKTADDFMQLVRGRNSTGPGRLL